MSNYSSVDEMVKDLSSGETYRLWKIRDWYKFKNEILLRYILIRYRISCFFYGDAPVVFDEEMSRISQSISSKIVNK